MQLEWLTKCKVFRKEWNSNVQKPLDFAGTVHSGKVCLLRGIFVNAFRITKAFLL